MNGCRGACSPNANGCAGRGAPMNGTAFPAPDDDGIGRANAVAANVVSAVRAAASSAIRRMLFTSITDSEILREDARRDAPSAEHLVDRFRPGTAAQLAAAVGAAALARAAAGRGPGVHPL